jgi:hypothetical protein
MIPAIGYMKTVAVPGVDLLSGLVSYWKFNDNYNQPLLDSHGSNDFPIPPFQTTAYGKSGNYAIHNGYTDSAFYTTGIGTALTDISISAWGKFRGNLYERVELFCVGTYVFGSNITLQYYNGDVKVYLTNGSTYQTISYPVTDAVWHHFCAIRNTTTGKLELWINGDLLASANLSITGTLSINNRIYMFSKLQTAPMSTMSEGISYAGCDESCIYNIALNSDQITALANNAFYNNF